MAGTWLMSILGRPSETSPKWELLCDACDVGWAGSEGSGCWVCGVAGRARWPVRVYQM